MFSFDSDVGWKGLSSLVLTQDIRPDQPRSNVRALPQLRRNRQYSFQTPPKDELKKNLLQEYRNRTRRKSCECVDCGANSQKQIRNKNTIVMISMQRKVMLANLIIQNMQPTKTYHRLSKYANMYSYMQQNEQQSGSKEPTFLVMESVSEMNKSSKQKNLAPISIKGPQFAILQVRRVGSRSYGKLNTKLQPIKTKDPTVQTAIPLQVVKKKSFSRKLDPLHQKSSYCAENEQVRTLINKYHRHMKTSFL